MRKADKQPIRKILSPVFRAIYSGASILIFGFFLACGGAGNSQGPQGPPPVQGPATLSSLSPSSVEAGSPDFTLTVNGVNFIPSCTVEWWNTINLFQLQTTFISSSQLRAVVSADHVATVRAITIEVSCPANNYLPFLVTGFPRTELQFASNDIAWDSVHHLIYRSVPGTVSGGDSVAALDPVTGTIVTSVYVGNNPDVLAISDDCQYLYVGVDEISSIERFILPDLQPDITFPVRQAPSPIGPNYPSFAFDIQVAPGHPRTVAVSIGYANLFTPEEGGVTIFDDATPRPTPIASWGEGGGGLFSSLQWGADETRLYGGNSGSTGADLYVLSVDSAGVTQIQDYPGVVGFNGNYPNRIHFVPATRLIYTDTGGVFNPDTGVHLQGPSAIGVTAIDQGLGVGFHMIDEQCFNEYCKALSSYDLTTLLGINSILMSNIVGDPLRMIRWGDSALAFNTDTGQIYLVDISTILHGPTSMDALKGMVATPSQRIHSGERVATTTLRRRGN